MISKFPSKSEVALGWDFLGSQFPNPAESGLNRKTTAINRFFVLTQYKAEHVTKNGWSQNSYIA